jgi:hypothetical protein
MLHDVYGHFMSSESSGFADAFMGEYVPNTAPLGQRQTRRLVCKTFPCVAETLELTNGLEPLTCSLRDRDEDEE